MQHQVIEAQKMSPHGYRIIGEYGLAVEGPVIILVLASPAVASWLKGLFLGMVGSEKTVDLVTQPGIVLKNVRQLELIRLPGERPGRLARARRSIDFAWSANDEEWRAKARIVDPLVQGQKVHQYLTSYDRDDARIEVCLRTWK